MDQQRIANFMNAYGKRFPADKRAYIEDAMRNCPDEKYNLLATINFKNPTPPPLP